MGREQQRYAPQPGTGSRGAASVASGNNGQAVNTLGGVPVPAADVSMEIPALLTSRTGGRFRCAGSISGTTTAGDEITVTLEANINGAGYAAIAVQLLEASAGSGRFACAFDMLSAVIPAGQTFRVRIRGLNEMTNPLTVNDKAGLININAEEISA